MNRDKVEKLIEKYRRVAEECDDGSFKEALQIWSDLMGKHPRCLAGKFGVAVGSVKRWLKGKSEPFNLVKKWVIKVLLDSIFELTREQGEDGIAKLVFIETF